MTVAVVVVAEVMEVGYNMRHLLFDVKLNKSGIRLLSRIINSPDLSFNGHSWRSLQTLAYEEVRTSPDGPYDSTAFVLHGLLGSGRNWRSFSRNLLSRLSNSSSSEWRVVLVDLRNHGKSAELEGFDPPHDMVNAAKDLAKLIESQDWAWPDVVMGHSMGGKVALQFLESCNRGDYGNLASLPKQLWVLDSVPGNVNPENSDGEVEKVLKTLQGLPSLVPSRKWFTFIERLSSKGSEESKGRVSAHVLPNSGHWVHVDNPKGLLDLVAPKISSL
ncbi:uncharacterized protein LOC127150402 [Cucumis melo]|uniref:Uncharacterized protein LOC127150402 n=1 Tax=Cucumis melo TaxID=3656 RepID=A0ABM3L208_CUCME|nr:uncharacterized protein LOC127150402 [Cucumis melo]